MRNRSAALLLFLFVLAASSCSRTPKRAFPLVQKYTTQAGDLFYFRPRDGQFVLLERRKALAVAVAPEPDIEAYSYDGQITVGQPQGDMLQSRIFVEKIGAQQALALTADGRTLAGGDANGVVTLWGIPTANLTLHLDVPASILCLAFSPDGNWLAIGLAKPAGEPADTVWLYEIHTRFGDLPIVAEVVSVPGDHSVKSGPRQEGLIEGRSSTQQDAAQAAAAGAAVGAVKGVKDKDKKEAAEGAALGALTAYLMESGRGHELNLPKGAKLELELERALYLVKE